MIYDLITQAPAPTLLAVVPIVATCAAIVMIALATVRHLLGAPASPDRLWVYVFATLMLHDFVSWALAPTWYGVVVAGACIALCWWRGDAPLWGALRRRT